MMPEAIVVPAAGETMSMLIVGDGRFTG